MIGTALALFTLLASPSIPRCVIPTPSSLPLSPVFTVLTPLFLLILFKSKDEVLSSGVSW